jgi:hypothetical protein
MSSEETNLKTSLPLFEEKENLLPSFETPEVEAPVCKPAKVEKSISEMLIDRVSRGKIILEECQEELTKTLLVGGKSLQEWKTELLIKIPEDSDDIRDLDITLNKLAYSFQRTESILATYEMQEAVANNLFEEKYATEYSRVLDAKTKKVAADKIKQKVLSDCDLVNDILSAAQVASVVTEYFKRILRALDAVQKCVESRIRLLQIKTRRLET